MNILSTTFHNILKKEILNEIVQKRIDIRFGNKFKSFFEHYHESLAIKYLMIEKNIPQQSALNQILDLDLDEILNISSKLFEQNIHIDFADIAQNSAQTMLGSPNFVGTSKYVWELSPYYVLKVAKQNNDKNFTIESNPQLQSNFGSNILSSTKYVGKSRMWHVVEKVNTINEQNIHILNEIFPEINSENFNNMFNQMENSQFMSKEEFILNIFAYIGEKDFEKENYQLIQKFPNIKKVFNQLKKLNKFSQTIKNKLGGTIHFYDIRPENIGYVQEPNGQKRFVIIDYDIF